MRLILILTTCLLMMGCSLVPNRNASEKNLKSVTKLGSMYMKYVDADTNLSKDSKKVKKFFVDQTVSHAAKMLEVSE